MYGLPPSLWDIAGDTGGNGGGLELGVLRRLFWVLRSTGLREEYGLRESLESCLGRGERDRGRPLGSSRWDGSFRVSGVRRPRGGL
jgi:hypothetical protein